MTNQTMALPHSLSLNERKSLTMTGVTEVVSFDDTSVVLKTGLGMLEVQGQQLQLKTLMPDGGQVVIDGHISALFYQEPKDTRSFWKRLIG